MAGELKKILLSPMPYMLLIGCLIMNGWMIWNYSSQKEIVSVSADMAEEQGDIYVTEKNIDEWYQPFEAFDAEDKVQQGIPPVRNMLSGAVELANSMDYKYLADNFISGMELSGSAKEFAVKEYENIQNVIDKNHKNKTDAAFFVPCNQDFFSMYAKMLPLFLTIQSIVAAVLMIIRLADDPFSSHIESLVYTSAYGRKINRKKLAAGLTAGIVFTIFLWAMTILAANAVMPLGKLWGTPIGSMMILDNFSPIISWIPINVAQFVLCQLVVCLAVAILFMCAAFTLALRLKNGFYAFMILCFICACVYALTSLIPRIFVLYFLLQCNPVDLARKAGHWFVSGSAFLAPKGYEIFTIVLWGTILVIFAMRQMKIFEKEDI